MHALIDQVLEHKQALRLLPTVIVDLMKELPIFIPQPWPFLHNSSINQLTKGYEDEESIDPLLQNSQFQEGLFFIRLFRHSYFISKNDFQHIIYRV